jgi:hypothetical protein
MHSTSSRENRSMDDLLGAGAAGDSEAGSAIGEGAPRGQRRVKSEAASPSMTSSSFAQLNGQLPPLDLSGIKYTPYVPNSADFFGALSDHEQPMFSAGLSAGSVDWSNFDGLGLASKTDDFAPSSYSQPQSYGGLDFAGSEVLPTMTTTTSISGEVSEVEDFLSNTLEEFDTFQNNVSTNGFALEHTNAGLVGSTDFTSLDFEYSLMKKAGSKFLPTPSSLAGDDPTLLASSAPGYSSFTALEEEPGLWMSDFQGLPNLTDSATESSMPSFWDGQ